MDVLIDGDIVLHGVVGTFYGLIEDEAFFDAKDVLRALAQLGRDADVVVRVNSPGGEAVEGAAIHAALAAHRGRKKVVIEGQACSAASLLAMAGDEIVMRRGSVMMIHDPSSFTMGTAEDHEKTIELLEALSGSYAQVYADKAGITAEQARADMREEIWLTPDQAVERGYADSTDEAAEAIEPIAFNYRQYRHAPEPLVALADARGWTRRKLPDQSSKGASMAAEKTSPAGQPAPDADAIRREATMAERTRAKAILGSEEAKGREGLAHHFAYETEMSAEAAIAALKAAPKAEAAPAAPAGKSGFEAAMDRAGNPQVGPDDPQAGDATAYKPGAAKANMQRLVGAPKH